LKHVTEINVAQCLRQAERQHQQRSKESRHPRILHGGKDDGRK
jgi:hypothetical protein